MKYYSFLYSKFKVRLVCLLICVGILFIVFRKFNKPSGLVSHTHEVEHRYPTHNRTEFPALNTESYETEKDAKDKKASSENNTSNVEASTMESINVEDSVVPYTKQLFEDLINHIVDKIPTDMTNLKRRMYMDASKFAVSENEKIQTILSKYNNKILSISSLRLKGNCYWKIGTAKSRNPHEISFLRDGFQATQLCGGYTRTIKSGVAFIPAAENVTGGDQLDSYYLLPLAVYNPREFLSFEEESIEVIYYTQERKEFIQTYKLSSPRHSLYFDNKNGQLKRICFHNSGSLKDYLQVDFLRYTDFEDISFPLMIHLTVLGKEAFQAPAGAIPDYKWLEIDPQTLQIER